MKYPVFFYISEEVLVTRSCWSSNSTEVPSDFFQCSKLSQGRSCYCRDSKGDNPCNGAPTTLTSISMATAILSVILSRVF